MGKRMEEAVERHRVIQRKNLLGGGVEHIDRQHGRGKLTARERVECLVDPGTFSEFGTCVGTTSRRIDGRVPYAPCDGAVAGTGRVHGRLIIIHASDFTVLGGSIGAQHKMKFTGPLEMAARWGIPMVNLLDSSGIGDGAAAVVLCPSSMAGEYQNGGVVHIKASTMATFLMCFSPA